MRRRGKTLVVPGRTHRRLRSHLFPGDGLEAAALLLCARVDLRRTRLIVRDMLPVAHEACARRTRDALSWPGEYVEMAIDRAEAEGLTVIAVHSHPGGLFAFSAQDDASDRILMPALFHGTGKTRDRRSWCRTGGCAGACMTRAGRKRRWISLCAPATIFISGGPIGEGAIPVAFTAGMTEWPGASAPA